MKEGRRALPASKAYRQCPMDKPPESKTLPHYRIITFPRAALFKQYPYCLIIQSALHEMGLGDRFFRIALKAE